MKSLKQLFISGALIFAGYLILQGNAQSTHVGHTHTTAVSVIPTTKETRLIPQVRVTVEGLDVDEILLTDETFKRYLMKTRSDVGLAAKAIQQTSEWRRQNNVDLLAADDISLLKDSLPYECTGKTVEGNPVFYIPLGKWNLRKIQRDRQNARLRSYLIQLFEFNLRTASSQINRKTEHPNYQSIFIVDLQGFTLRQLISGWGKSFRTLVEAARIYESHYPNTVKKWYVIRAPRNFRAMWFVLRRFISPDVASTVDIYSRWSIKWRSELRQSIPKQSLPRSLHL